MKEYIICRVYINIAYVDGPQLMKVCLMIFWLYCSVKAICIQ